MDGGVWLWVGLGLLILILAMGGRNECQGILFLLKRNRGEALDFPRESHSSMGKASAGLALLWGLLFFARVPMLYRQFTPGFNALLVTGAVLLAIFTVISGWFVTRSKSARIKIMVHQAIGYFFIILMAALLLLAIQENFFPESLAQ